MFFYYFFRTLIYIPVRILYPAKVLNKGSFPKNKGLIVLSNHLRWVDVLLIAIYTPGYRRFLAKKEIGKNIFVRLFGFMLGVIFIDREGDDIGALRKCIKTVEKGGGINLFPEGTRNRENTDLQEIKSGATLLALKCHATLVPVMIHQKSKLFKKNYIYVGEPFDLSEINVRIVNKAALEKGTEIIQSKMLLSKECLDQSVCESLK